MYNRDHYSTENRLSMYNRDHYSWMYPVEIAWYLITPCMVKIVMSGHEMTFPARINVDDGTNGRYCFWESHRMQLCDTILWVIYVTVGKICVA